MSLLQKLRKSFAPDREIDDELAFHIDEKTHDLIAGGMAPDAARNAAQRAFGNPALLRDQTRDADTFAWLDAIRRDLTIAVRSLARRKGLTITAILSLAIGIGATTALFGFADPVFLRPLPIPHPEEVVAIAETNHGERSGSNALRMADWAAQVPGFSAVGGYYSESSILTGEGSPVRLHVLRSFGKFLAVLGEQPTLGRPFTDQEERGLGEPVALLSARIWKSRYHADPSTIGRVLRLNGTATTVIGVLPEGARYPEAIDVLTPAPITVQKSSRRAGFLQVIARMKPGISKERIQSELQTVAARLAAAYPATDANRAAHAVGLQEDAGQDARRPVLLLFGTAALVLLIACVNVASLLLARAVERQRETSIRLALGASRGSLLGHYLSESFVLSLAGGLGGLALGKLGFTVLLRFLPKGLDLPAPATFDWRVAFFGLAAALVSGLVFGWAPAWEAAFRTRLSHLRTGTRTTTGLGGLWARRFLVAAQVALSVLLLVAVGLSAKSLYLIREMPLGIAPASLLTMQINFAWDTPPARLEGFSTRVLDELRGTPGVISVGMVDRLPLGGGTQSGPVGIRGVELSPELQARQVDYRSYKGDYFRAAGISFLAGREPRTRATDAGPGEVVVNEALARRFFPNGDALGRSLTTNPKPRAGQSSEYYEITGIVSDVRVTPTQTEQPAEVFLPSRESYWPYQNYIVKAAGDPTMLARAAREAVKRVDPNQLIDKIAPMRDEISGASSDRQIRLWLLGCFGVIAMILAAIGLYGVLASDVAQRTNEIGIRMALGADPRRIARDMVLRGLVIAGVGIAVGLAAALLLGRVVASFLYGVEPGDPMVLAGVVCLLAGVAAGASYLPARRAAGVDPVVALRHD